VPDEYKNRTRLIVSIEGDSDPPVAGFAYQVQFAQWTLASAKGICDVGHGGEDGGEDCWGVEARLAGRNGMDGVKAEAEALLEANAEGMADAGTGKEVEDEDESKGVRW
jgi:hypothetical protein